MKLQEVRCHGENCIKIVGFVKVGTGIMVDDTHTGYVLYCKDCRYKDKSSEDFFDFGGDIRDINKISDIDKE